VLFNKQLAKHYGDEDTSFYKLFKESDLDGSQRISFNELEKLQLVRPWQRRHRRHRWHRCRESACPDGTRYQIA